MEFHAWINPYRTKTTLKSELAPNHVYNIHPEWFVTYGDQLYFDPALPETRQAHRACGERHRFPL